jgi:hypothetical protein
MDGFWFELGRAVLRIVSTVVMVVGFLLGIVAFAFAVDWFERRNRRRSRKPLPRKP